MATRAVITQNVIPTLRALSGFTRTFGMKVIRHIAWVLLALILLTPSIAQAAITTVASNVSPGWSNNRKTVVFYNGTRFFLLYSKGGSDLYYQSSTDNVTWSGESTLIGGASERFNIYLVSDTKFDLVYHGSPNATYVRTCTIAGATITAGSASTVEGIAHNSLAVARSGAGDRIYVVGMFLGFLRVYSADQTGDALGALHHPLGQQLAADVLNLRIVRHESKRLRSGGNSAGEGDSGGGSGPLTRKQVQSALHSAGEHAAD